MFEVPWVDIISHVFSMDSDMDSEWGPKETALYDAIRYDLLDQAT